MIIDAVNRRIISPRFIFAALTPHVMVFGARGLGLAKAVRGFVPLLEEETRALPSEDTAKNTSIQDPRSRFSADTKSDSTLILDFQPKDCENYIPVFTNHTA